MASGGARQGQPGKAYTNRTDLAANRATQPITTVPGQTYGKQAEQAAAQQVNPLPQATPMRMPSFSRPSERPNEPVTTGLPMGPGPGPEVMPSQPEDMDPQDLERLRASLPALEFLANQPTTSRATRNYIRRLRGSLPPEDL